VTSTTVPSGSERYAEYRPPNSGLSRGPPVCHLGDRRRPPLSPGPRRSRWVLSGAVADRPRCVRQGGPVAIHYEVDPGTLQVVRFVSPRLVGVRMQQSDAAALRLLHAGPKSWR
jgi:hypothetical protein